MTMSLRIPRCATSGLERSGHSELPRSTTSYPCRMSAQTHPAAHLQRRRSRPRPRTVSVRGVVTASDTEPPASRSARADRSPSPRRATWFVMLAALVAGTLSAAIVWRIAEHNAETRQAALVDVAVGAADDDVNELVIAMSGTS